MFLALVYIYMVMKILVKITARFKSFNETLKNIINKHFEWNLFIDLIWILYLVNNKFNLNYYFIFQY